MIAFDGIPFATYRGDCAVEDVLRHFHPQYFTETAYTAIAMRAHLGITLLRHMLATLHETGHHPSINQPPGVRSTATAGFVAFATAGGLTAHLEPCSTVAPGIFATASMGCVTSLCNPKPASPRGLVQNTAVAAAPLLPAEPRHRSL